MECLRRLSHILLAAVYMGSAPFGIYTSVEQTIHAHGFLSDQTVITAPVDEGFLIPLVHGYISRRPFVLREEGREPEGDPDAQAETDAAAKA